MLLETTERGAETILITQEMLSHWEISLEELHQTALNNTPKILQADFKTMRSVICELMGEPCSEDVEENYMYVLSNQYRHFGAGCMLYDRVLEDIGNQINEDFYILPSSIHEVMLLRDQFGDKIDTKAMKQLIASANAEVVGEDEVLSSNLYKFDPAKREIVIVE